MDEKNKLVFNGITETTFMSLATELKQVIQANDLHYFYFKGDIGTGKTTYIRNLLRKFGIKENVRSPSFNMIELYELDRTVFGHVDLFRMLDPIAWRSGELISLFEDTSNLIFLEWPEKAEGLPPPDIEFNISLGIYGADEKKRDLSVYLKSADLLNQLHLKG